MYILLGGAFPKRHRPNCGVIAIIHKVPILGRHKLPHFILKHHFAVIIAFDVTWYLFVLNNIDGVMIPSLCTLYFNSNGICCAQTLGSFFILFRVLFRFSHNIFI
jgi:hypothetical protein